jgi:hypothetical protein
MKTIIVSIRLFIKESNKLVLIFCTLFSAVLIFLNYYFGLERAVVKNASSPFQGFIGHVIIYSIAFFIPYIFCLLIVKKNIIHRRFFYISLIVAPIIFALKVHLNTEIILSTDTRWNAYWNDIIYWPARMVLLVALLTICSAFLLKKKNALGLSPDKYSYKPYFIMVLLMMPLIALAASQPDFQAVYPKMKNILPLPPGAEPGWLYTLFYQLGYGSDFFSIEVFFRGFLVVGLMKWVGKDAILPMACFYCSIHFGKPLGECISSYFGGALLGIVSYHTRSIYGGLIVHLGIAWLMEVAGYISHQ